MAFIKYPGVGLPPAHSQPRRAGGGEEWAPRVGIREEIIPPVFKRLRQGFTWILNVLKLLYFGGLSLKN